MLYWKKLPKPKENYRYDERYSQDDTRRKTKEKARGLYLRQGHKIPQRQSTKALSREGRPPAQSQHVPGARPRAGIATDRQLPGILRRLQLQDDDVGLKSIC